MEVHDKDGLKYYTFERLKGFNVTHAIFTRQGGVSEGNFKSLNLGGTCGDRHQAVVENHRRVFDAVGRPFASRFDVWQVHGKDIICTTEPRPENQAHIPADGIFTDNPEVTLIMRFADCVPLVFYDPVQKVAGIVHAGWQGTLQQIGIEAVRVAKEKYRCQVEDLFVGIGPSICAECYQVGKDVAKKFRAQFGDLSSAFILDKHNAIYLDLWKANEMMLRNVGIQNIETSSLCTAHNLEDWYSHRAEKSKTGRFGVILGLNADE